MCVRSTLKGVRIWCDASAVKRLMVTLQSLCLEGAGAQGFQRLSHAAELVRTSRRWHCFVEVTSTQACDCADQELHGNGLTGVAH